MIWILGVVAIAVGAGMAVDHFVFEPRRVRQHREQVEFLRNLMNERAYNRVATKIEQVLNEPEEGYGRPEA